MNCTQQGDLILYLIIKIDWYIYEALMIRTSKLATRRYTVSSEKQKHKQLVQIQKEVCFSKIQPLKMWKLNENLIWYLFL